MIHGRNQQKSTESGQGNTNSLELSTRDAEKEIPQNSENQMEASLEDPLDKIFKFLRSRENEFLENAAAMKKITRERNEIEGENSELRREIEILQGSDRDPAPTDGTRPENQLKKRNGELRREIELLKGSNRALGAQNKALEAQNTNEELITKCERYKKTMKFFKTGCLRLFNLLKRDGLCRLLTDKNEYYGEVDNGKAHGFGNRFRNGNSFMF